MDKVGMQKKGCKSSNELNELLTEMIEMKRHRKVLR
jgi:hypothetical protein